MIDLRPDSATALVESLDAGQALPSGWYSDGELFGIETDRVLRRAWHFVAHNGELAAAGDQLPLMLAGVPIVLVRGVDDEIRGFLNICRHRAHLVVLEPRNRKALTCSYHGWSYGLDGRFKHAPRVDVECDLDPAACSLVPVQVGRWGPTIWANVDVDAPPFELWVAGLPDLVAERGVDVDEHVFGFERRWEIRANWKVFMDNAVECYHCPTAHPELSRVLETNPDLQETVIPSRTWVSHSIPFRRTADATSTGAPRTMYHFHWIFPTTYFQYAGSGFDVGTIGVLGVDRISFRHLTFVRRDADPADVEVLRERLMQDPTIPQDVGICERVQLAHGSGVAPRGRLLRESEALVRHFQRVVAETVLDLPPSR